VGHNFQSLFSILSYALLILVHTTLFAQEVVSPDSTEWQRRLELLRSVPYVGLSDEETEKEDTGIKRYDHRKAYDGYNLICIHSTSTAYLMDIKGQEIHRWTYGKKYGNATRHATMNDHVIALDNGDAVILKKNEGVVQVSWNSELLWEVCLRAHHDIAQAPDGTFYVLIQELMEHRGLEVWFDAIVHLDARGEEIGRWFTYDHLDQIRQSLDTKPFLDTILDSALAGRPGGSGGMERLKEKIAQRYRYDYFHTNTITVLPQTSLGERDPRFRPGHLLVCFRNVDQIAVLEKDTYRVLWSWGVGELEGPHHPTMLEDGHILVFNNGVKRGYSSVLELDPVSGDIVWEYKADPPRSFYSYSRGSAQRLPNGNTLICESDKGRAFEVTRDGEVVWEWQNPVMVGKHCETFYRMWRLSVERIDELIQDRKDQLHEIYRGEYIVPQPAQ